MSNSRALILRLLSSAIVLMGLVLIGCAAIYLNARFVRHDVSSAMPAILIVLCVGVIATLAAWISIYVTELRKNRSTTRDSGAS
jgi:hypothetical protein